MLQPSAFWPFKVIQGRWFWYQSKARIQLLISPSLWVWSYLAPFLRYSDLLAKNCLFFLSCLIRRPRSLSSLWNFALKLTTRKLWGYPPVKTLWSYLESFWHDTRLWRLLTVWVYLCWNFYDRLRKTILLPRDALMHSALLRLHVVCLSVRPYVCPSVTLVDQDHIGWKSWKLSARTLSQPPSLFVAERPSTYSQGKMGKFGGDHRWGGKKWRAGAQKRQYLRNA